MFVNIFNFFQDIIFYASIAYFFFPMPGLFSYPIFSGTLRYKENHFNMGRSVLFIICLILGLSLFGQQASDTLESPRTRIQLVQADRLMYNKDFPGPDIQRLLGNVILEHDSMFLHCDSAYLYEKKNSMDAWGNIRIVGSDSLFIYGEELYYDGNTGVAKMRKDVRLEDRQLTLTTDHLDYDLANNLGYYFNGGRIEDTSNVLTSELGYYFADDMEFFFKDSVHLVNPEYTMDSDTLMYHTATEVAFFYGPSFIRSDTNTIYCENGWYDTRRDLAQFNENAILYNSNYSLQGDSLFYDRNRGLGKAFVNVTVADSTQDILIKGHLAEFWEVSENALITDSAHAIHIDNGDSLFLHGDTLRYMGDTASREGKHLMAYYGVKFFRPNIQGSCDSLIYSLQDSVIRMFSKPVLWTENSQLYADYVEFHTAKSRNQKMLLRNNSFMAEADLDSASFNQVKGKNMYGYFRDDRLHKVYVEGNAETVYFVRDEEEALVGINKAASSDLYIYVADKRIERLVFIKEPGSILFPPGQLNPSQRLIDGFTWHDQLRPRSRHDIFRK